MLLNFILGFIIPLIFGIWLFKKAKKIILFIWPLNSIFSFIIINTEIYFNFWDLYPFSINDAFVAIPYCLGLYPLNACLLIYAIDKKFLKVRNSILVFLFTLLATFEEIAGILVGRIVYSNGWNIGFTFISYLIPSILVFLYYKYLKNSKLL